MNKRGVSQIVTTILIILLVLAAIIIVWQAVKTTVETGAETIAERTECMGLDLTITAIDVSGDTVSVTRNAGGPSEDVIPIFLVKGVSDTAMQNVALGQLASHTYELAADISTGDEVTVGAKVGDVVCDTSATETA